MDVYWLEQTEADVPTENQWLSAREMLCLCGMRFAKRRADWRLGRWTAKRALAARLNLSSDLTDLANIEILAAPSGAPHVFVFDQPSPVTISISHRAGTALCTVALSQARIGCDLEIIEPRNDAFISDYFTVSERVLLERARVEERPLLVTLLWSAKESALKALHVGLRFDTNCIDVSFADALPTHSEQCRQKLHLFPLLAADLYKWRCFHACYSGTHVFHGWWRHANHMVRTIVSDPCDVQVYRCDQYDQSREMTRAAQWSKY